MIYNCILNNKINIKMEVIPSLSNIQNFKIFVMTSSYSSIGEI